MQKKINIIKLLLTLGIIFLSTHFSFAASLGLSPSSLQRSVGSTFSVSVYVSSPGKSVNAISGVVTFPVDKLQVVSISKSSSIMNLWVQDPSFSNTSGTIDFEGIVLNPGYTGSQGNVVSVVFRARAQGVAQVGFSSGAVLANDGSGTNVIQGLGTATYTIGEAVEEPTQPTPAATATTLPAPRISSDTHTDESKWYNNNTPEFSWRLPTGATEVRTLLATSPNSTPSVRYAPPISERKLTDPINDGVYYFLLQTRTADGWSEVGRYRINIDTKGPNPFMVDFPNGTEAEEGREIDVEFVTTADGAPVVSYEIYVNDLLVASLPATDGESQRYSLNPLYPGNHTVRVVAIDSAGNRETAVGAFTTTRREPPVMVPVTYQAPPRDERFAFFYDAMTFARSHPEVFFVTLIALSLLVITIWYRHAMFLGTIRREEEEAELIVEKSFAILRKELHNYITSLKASKSRKKIVKEKLEFLEQFEEDLLEAKDIIVNEVQDISRLTDK